MGRVWKTGGGEKGQRMVAYALILVLVAIVVIAALALLGKNLRGTYKTTMGAFRGPEESQQTCASS